jgi:hypothetical protein
MSELHRIQADHIEKQMFAAKTLAIQSAMAPTFTSDEAALRWMSDMGQPRKVTDDKVFKDFVNNPDKYREVVEVNGEKVSKWVDSIGPREVAQMYAIKSIGIVSDAGHGKLNSNPIWSKLYGTEKGLLTQPENYPVMATFQAWQAPSDIDMGWMQAFSSFDLRSSAIGKLVDFIGSAKFYELTDNQPIQYSNIGIDKAVDIIKRGFGGGHNIDMDLIRVAPMVTLNMAFTSLRFAAEAKKSELGYDTIHTEFTGTESYSTSVLVTLNNAGKALKKRLIEAKLGISITQNSQLLLYVNPTHQELVEQALFSVRGPDGTNPVMIHNIRPVYSYLFPALPDGVKKGGHLILPGQKAAYATFQDMTTNEETHFDTQRLKVAAVEKYSMKFFETKQNIRVQFEA